MLRKIIKITLTTSAITVSLIYSFLNFRSYFLRNDIDEKQKFIVTQGYLVEVEFSKAKHIKALELKIKPEFEFQKKSKNFEEANLKESMKTLQIMADGLDLNKLKGVLDSININKDFITVKHDSGNFIWSIEKNSEQLIDYNTVKKYNQNRNIYSLWGGITFLVICLTFLYFFLGKKPIPSRSKKTISV